MARGPNLLNYDGSWCLVPSPSRAEQKVGRWVKKAHITLSLEGSGTGMGPVKWEKVARDPGGGEDRGWTRDDRPGLLCSAGPVGSCIFEEKQCLCSFLYL